MNKGIGYGIGTYVMWGLLPVYWKCIHHVPAVQLVCHRIVWSCLFLAGILLFTHRAKGFRWSMLTPPVLCIYIAASLLIAINWLVYIWAVNSGFILESSLGYFINPLLNVLLGVLFFRERLRVWQWISLGVALAGVVYLTIALGRLPWISLTLAISFALYGLAKKMAPLGVVDGLALETGLLAIPALLYLVYSESIGTGSFLHGDVGRDILLVGGGLMTTAPLLLFAAALQRIPLSLMGVLQYLSPSLQFLIGVGVYREPVSASRLVGFALVWAALVIFGVEGALSRRKRKPEKSHEPQQTPL